MGFNGGMPESFEDGRRLQHPEGTLCSRCAGMSSQDGEGMYVVLRWVTPTS